MRVVLGAVTHVYRGLEDVTEPISRRDVHGDVLRPNLLPRLQDQSRSVFAGQNVGVTQIGQVWLVTFVHYDLGYFDDKGCQLESIENPLGANVLPMSSE